MSDTHTLIIKADAEVPADTELFDYEIHCPSVTDACRMWIECEVPNCRTDNPGVDNVTLHGDRHQLFPSSGTWCVPSDTCYLIAADEMPDAAAFLTTQADLCAGEYTIGHDFSEGLIADFQLIEKVTA